MNTRIHHTAGRLRGQEKNKISYILFFLTYLLILFLFINKNTFAATTYDWQATPQDNLKNYKWSAAVPPDFIPFAFEEFNGGWRWATTSPYAFTQWNLYPDTPQYNIGSYEEGFYLWAIYTDSISDDNYFRYDTCSGGYRYTSTRTRLKTLNIGGINYTLARWNGIYQADKACVKNIHIADTRIAQGGDGKYSILLILYTDDDLNSLINNEADFYNYINNKLPTLSITPNITLPPNTCDDLGTIAGALCRVLSYLFTPSQNVISQFSNLKTTLENKIPFVYWFSIKNALNTLNNTSTPAFNLPENINNIPLFTTIKNGLKWVLWVFFAFWIIHRFTRFEF